MVLTVNAHAALEQRCNGTQIHGTHVIHGIVHGEDLLEAELLRKQF